MANDKYRIIVEEPERLFGHTLYRIEALKDFGCCKRVADIRPDISGPSGERVIKGFWVKKGDIGGYVEGEWNLSADDNSWVGPGSAVFDKARVSGNAWLHGVASAKIPTVTARDRARISGNAEIRDSATVRDDGMVIGTAIVRQFARIEDKAKIIDGEVGGYAHLFGEVYMRGADKVLDFNARPSRIGDNYDLERALECVESMHENNMMLKKVNGQG